MMNIFRRKPEETPEPETESAPETVEEIIADPDAQLVAPSHESLDEDTSPLEILEETAPEIEEPLPIEPAPLRALVPGAFLAGELEIQQVLERGTVNYYLADISDYGPPQPKLVAERLAKNEAVENPEIQSPLFPIGKRFSQGDREYLSWDWENLEPLDEWHAPANDEKYLEIIGQIARGLAELESHNLRSELARPTLFFDGEIVRCFGFLDVPEENSMSALQQLSALSSRLLKQNLAGQATLRLDNEFGALPLADETKNFAQRLSDGEFASIAEVVAELEGLKAPTEFEIALLSDVGIEREINEDCGLIWKFSRAGHSQNFEIEVLAVADGMGGHEGGEVASDLTLKTLETAITRRANLDFSDNSVSKTAVFEILGEVNDAVLKMNEDPPYAAMRHKPGATLVFAIRCGARVFIGNVGDSRAYRWNAQTGLERLSKDHSYVQDLLDAGTISEAEAWGHPDGSMITAHIGMPKLKQKDVFLRLLGRGDRLFLVSDGVVDMLRDDAIEEIVANSETARDLCRKLVEAANLAGGGDNITVSAGFCG